MIQPTKELMKSGTGTPTSTSTNPSKKATKTTAAGAAVAGTAARDGDSVFGVCHSSTGLTHSVGAARALCACEEAFAACGACLAGVGLAFNLNEVVPGGTSVNLAVTCTAARDVLVCGSICDG